METYGCESCNKLFIDQVNPGACPYCRSIYYTWISFKQRTKKEVNELLKRFK